MFFILCNRYVVINVREGGKAAILIVNDEELPKRENSVRAIQEHNEHIHYHKIFCVYYLALIV